MSKNMIRRRFLSLCLVLAMMASFPGVAWADITETTNTVGDLYVTCPTYDCWMFNPNNVSGKWATTLEGWAVRQYNNRMFPLVVHPVRVPDIWIDSGRNDAGREKIVAEYRYKGTYWTTTENGSLDIDHGSNDPNSEYNLYLDESTATLHLIGAYLKGKYCLSLVGNVKDIMGAETGALTIDLEGENKITAYDNAGGALSAGIKISPESSNRVTDDDLILTGDGSLEMKSGASGDSKSAESYSIFLENSDLIIDGPDVNINIMAGSDQFKYRTAIKADTVTVKGGSELNITLEEGSEGTAFDVQNLVIEEGASLSVTLTRNSSMFASSADTQSAFAASVFALSDDNSQGILQMEEGSKLKIILESGTADLSDVITADIDLSQVEFQVDGMLVLPSTVKVEDLQDNITGSGIVMILGDSSEADESNSTIYSIVSGSLVESREGLIDSSIEVSTGGNEITEDEDLGYTWTMEAWYIDEDGNLTKPVDGDGGDGTTGDDALNGNKANVNLFVQSPISPNPTDGNDSSLPSNAGEENTNDDTTNTASDDTIDVWTLTILRPNVIGDITINQVISEPFPMVAYDGDTYPADWVLLTEGWAEDCLQHHRREVEIRIVAEDRCNVYGDVEMQYTYERYVDGYTAPYQFNQESSVYPTSIYEYLKPWSRLTFETEEMYVESITCKSTKVKIDGEVNGIDIEGWQAELLANSELTLTKGISLTVNNTSVGSSAQRLINGFPYPIVLVNVRQTSYNTGYEYDENKIGEYKEQLKSDFLRICENSFIVDETSTYHVTVAGVIPVQVTAYVKSYISVTGKSDYECPQVRITLEDGNAADEDQGEDESAGEDEDKEGTTESSPLYVSATLTQEDCKEILVLPENSSLFPEGTSFSMEIDDNDRVYAYTISIPCLEQEEETWTGEGHKGSSSSSSGGSGSPLPTVDPDGGDGSETGGNETDGSSPDSGCSQPSNCVSDTLGQLTVNGAYQFKLTSTDGTVPTLTVNGSAFRAEIVSQEGNDYYVKIYAVGEAGSTGEVYVNGVRVATASIASTYGGVVSDTTAPFTVRQGEAYQFCFTSDTMPAMAAGSSSFTVVYVGNDGKKWYYKVYATGKPGDGCGFYVNGAPFATAIAHITA